MRTRDLLYRPCDRIYSPKRGIEQSFTLCRETNLGLPWVELHDVCLLRVLKRLVQLVDAKLLPPVLSIDPHNLGLDQIKLSSSQESSNRSENMSKHDADGRATPLQASVVIMTSGVVEAFLSQFFFKLFQDMILLDR